MAGYRGPKGSNTTPEELKRMIQLAEIGLPATVIAIRMNKSSATVRDLLAEHGRRTPKAGKKRWRDGYEG